MLKASRGKAIVFWNSVLWKYEPSSYCVALSGRASARRAEWMEVLEVGRRNL